MADGSRGGAEAQHGADAGGGRWIGRYRIIGELGEGGFGTVYLAQQTEPVRREVALKVLKPGMDSREIVARFEAERQALALMDHPGIAKVLDAGLSPAGQPYFVMELVRGVPLTDACDAAHLSLAERLELFEQVCHAVQHAHQKGIVHRDLKPSNILVVERDGAPTPVVIDFGIAKVIGDSLSTDAVVTQSFQLLGTPEYMAPEQAAGGGDVDTRADVYALGLLLYELITGSRPFNLRELQEAGYAEVLRIIREEDPPKPSTRVSSLGETLEQVARSRGVTPRTLGRELRGDLDWIVMKALEKERERRYASVEALAADVHRHQRNEPVSASPPSASYRLRKLVRRHRGAVAAAVVITLLVVLGSAGTGVGFVRASEQAERAGQEAERYARVAEVMTGMLQGVGPRVALGRDTQLLRDVLDETRARVDADASGATTRVGLEVEYTLRELLAGAYFSIGAFEPARENAERRLDLARELFGPHDPRTADAAVTVAGVQYEVAEHTAAVDVLPTALEDLLRAHGPTSVPVANARIQLANNLRELGQADAAKEQYLRVLEELDPQVEGGRDLLANATFNLAKLHDDLGEYEEALRRHTQALEFNREAHGDEHPSTASSLASVGRSHLELGDAETAEPFLVQSLATYRRLYEPDHQSLASGIFNLARLYKQQGRYAEAEPLYREMLAIDRANYAEDNRTVATSLLNLAGLLRRMGRMEESEELYLESMAMVRRLGLDDDRGLGITLSNWGMFLFEVGRKAEAAEVLAEAVALLEKHLGPEHTFTARCTQYLALALFEDGADLDEAARVSALALERLTAYYGAEHAEVAAALVLRARIEDARGDHAEAEGWWRRAIEVREVLLPTGDPLLFQDRARLGRTLVQLGQLDEAEELLLAAYEAADADPNAPASVRATRANFLSELYEAMDEADLAADWRAVATDASEDS